MLSGALGGAVGLEETLAQEGVVVIDEAREIAGSWFMGFGLQKAKKKKLRKAGYIW